MAAASARRVRIMASARHLLSSDARPTVADIAAAAGTSKAAFYREFASRSQLLDALRVDPEPGTGERILEAALDLVGARGLGPMSMDELAERAGVSRATLYRIFPGKPALFVGLLRAYSPLEPVSAKALAMRDQPPEVVMPEIARTAYRAVAGSNRIGVLRAIFLEVGSMSPDAGAAAQDLITTVLGSVGAYVMAQMAAGRLRPMAPLLALQSFVGPIFFHVMTRPLFERVVGLDVSGEEAVTTLAESWLRAMKPDAEERSK